jgi:hypothetical protein
MPRNDDNVVDLMEYERDRLAKSVGVLRYQASVNSCAFPCCGIPTSGVFCLDHATT